MHRDASFSSSTNKVGVVMWIRDEEGCFVLAKTTWHITLCSIDIGEALGLHHAICWVHELQLQNVDFEVELKCVADYFNRDNGDITEFGVIMDSNRHYCSFFFTKLSC